MLQEGHQRPVVVVLALALPVGLGVVACFPSIPADVKANLQWLWRQYAGTMTPRVSKPNAGIFLFTSPRPPATGSVEGEKRGEPVLP
jgi:hypothetical protein